MADQDFSLLFSLKSDSGAPAAQPEAAPAAASQDDFSLLLSLKEKPQAAGGSGVENFVREYKPLADRVAKKLGVAPEAVLGQWGLETGWGKSVIPGTNNLGNIKDFSGAGPKATDNMTGSRDAYRAYGSVEQFGDSFADLVGRRYKSAIGSGNDAGRYFTALKAGGYAEDPDYVSKGVAAARMAASALGQTAPQASRRDPYTNIQPASADGESFIGGLGKALWQGVKSTGRSVGATGNTYLGRLTDVELAAEAQKSSATQDPAALQALQQEVARRKAENPDAGILDAAADVISAAWGNKEGTAQLVANQAPNSAVALGGAWVGGKTGAALGAPLGPAGMAVGGVVGALAGMFLGNAVLETGGKAIEKAADGFTPEDRDAAISEGAKKAGVITAVDAATFKLGGAVAKGLNRGAIQAGARAEAKVLAEAGINISDGAEIVAALARNPVLRETAKKAGESAAKAASSASARAGTAGALLTSETGGEYAGEYLGELAATGKADPYDAALEAISSFSQSAPQAALSMIESAGNNLDTKAIVAAAPELAPVIEKAQQPNSPLSRAAMAGNTPEVVAQRQAERAAQAGALDDISAAETAPAQAKDPGARLAELEAIAKGAPAQQVTDDAGNPLTIPGEPGRFFTQEEKAEYDQLVAMKKATEEVRNADQPQVDEISARVDEISQSIRDNGTLQQMRDAGENTKDLLKDLAIAKSKSTRQDQREQAIARVEFALGWSDQPATAQAPARQQGDPILAALNDPAIEAQDREELSIAYQASKNPGLPERTRQAALDRAREIVGRYAAPVAPQPAQESAPAVLGDIQPQPGTPEEALRNAERREAGAYQFKAEGYPDEAQALQQEADSLREEAAVRREQIEADTRIEQVVAPEVATPRGPGPAAIRKRKATLRQLVDNGLNRVDRRDDGFYLVSQNGRQEFKLDGMADAQLARAAVTESIRDGAALANTAPTEAQIAAGNYKTGVIKFDGIDLAVENPQGSTRSGTDPNGERWETVMPANYGYIRGSAMAADGDKVDIYLPDNARAGSPAWIIDQYNDDGTFDETKSVLGVRTEEEAVAIYDAGYSDGSGPRRRGAITQMPIEDFKAWAMSPAAKKPAGAPRAAPADIIQAAQRDGVEIDGTMQVTVNGKPVEIGFVKELGKTESVSRGGRARRTSKKQGQVLQAIAQAFGKEIKFFYETGADVGDGFIMPNDPGTIYLNESSSLSPIVVFGHELMHQLKRDNPGAHAAIEAVVAKRMKTKKVQEAYGKLGYQNGQILEELVSDLGGDLMADSTFWSEVFDEVHANNDAGAARKIIAKLAEFITRAINALSQNLRSYADTGAGSALVTDMDAIRAAFKDALAGYIQAQGISKPAMQAEILRAGQEAKRDSDRADQAQTAINSVADESDITKSAARDDALTVEAYHFSRQPRSTLTTGAFGTGLQGSDRDAIMAHPDRRLRQRLSFYVNKGSGVRPEAGVGGIAHKATLSNIYDGDADVKRLKQGRDRRGFESAVLDAGYSGYLTRLEGTQPGQVILLGRQTVTPEVLGPRTNIPEAKVVPQPVARDMDIGDRINANKMLPAGKMEPADWKSRLQRLMPAEAAELDGTDVFDGSKAIYKDELVARIRKAATPIASRARQIETPEFRAWFGDSKVVDADGKPMVVYHGTNKEFDAFNTKHLGSFFTSSRSSAEDYGRNVVAAYLSLRNPLIVDAKGASWSDIQFTPKLKKMAAVAGLNFSGYEGGRLIDTDTLARLANMAGHDGLLVTNVDDAEGMTESTDAATVAVAFRPEQIKSAAGNSGAFDPSDPNITRSADRSAREAKIEKLAPVAQRGERIVGQRVTLTADEKQAIEFSSETTGVSAKEITRVVREHKLAHPPAQGWAPLVFTKAKTEKGKLVYEYEKVPYSFNADQDGRALKQDTPEYSRRVGAVARRMADEVRRVYQRATAGDKNAENILAQAGWYKSMRARLRHEFGGLGDLFADLLGATSPNTPVRDNWSNAVDSLRRATRGDFDELIPAWEAWADAVDGRETELRAWFNEQQATGKSKKAIKDSAEYKQKLDALVAARELPEALLPTKETGKKYGFNGRNVARAMVDLWRVVRDADPDVKRGGTAPKAVNFSGNLIGFRERATIDVWAARMLQRLSGGLRVPSMAEGGVSGLMRADGSTTLQFGFGQDVFSDAVKRIRKDPELKTNDTLAKINDDDLQAVVWFVEKEIWTANNWTSAAGEGGSFELEASLSGSAQQQRIRELRRVIDSSLSKPAAKAEARAELAKLERTVDRFVGGLSIQMSADTQGIDFVPQDSDMARLSNEISTSIYEDESATAVLASKALSTEGRYGGIERSLDLEVVTREGYRPGALWKKMLETARNAKQDSTFLSRVLRDEEQVDLLRHRPGVEIYFREAASREKLESVLGELAKEGVEFLTVIVDGRRMTDATRGQMPPAVGVRMQYVPEFEQRYGMDDLNGLDDAALAAKIQEKADEMSAMAERVAKSVGDVSFASQFWYETNVAFSHEYQEKIDAIATGTAQGAAQEVGGQEWSGQSVRAGLESADRQAREAAGAEPDGDVLGGDEAGAESQAKRIEALKELIACLGR